MYMCRSPLSVVWVSLGGGRRDGRGRGVLYYYSLWTLYTALDEEKVKSRSSKFPGLILKLLGIQTAKLL